MGKIGRKKIKRRVLDFPELVDNKLIDIQNLFQANSKDGSYQSLTKVLSILICNGWNHFNDNGYFGEKIEPKVKKIKSRVEQEENPFNKAKNKGFEDVEQEENPFNKGVNSDFDIKDHDNDDSNWTDLESELKKFRDSVASRRKLQNKSI